MVHLPLCAVRITYGYSINELAEFFEEEAEQLAKYEKDTSTMPLYIIRKYIKLFDVPLALIYIGTEDECIRQNREQKKGVKRGSKP